MCSKIFSSIQTMTCLTLDMDMDIDMKVDMKVDMEVAMEVDIDMKMDMKEDMEVDMDRKEGMNMKGSMSMKRVQNLPPAAMRRGKRKKQPFCIRRLKKHSCKRS